MLPLHVGLVSEVTSISTRELTRVGAALQKQVVRDFGPLWGVQATVNAFARLEDVPVGYWPVIVEDQIDQPGAAGVHEDRDGQPFALVQYSHSWPLTASHECLEMLADPFGNRVMAGPSVKPGQGRVEYLVEVCDPCEAAGFAYTVNGVLVSDFYTLHFFDPVSSGGVRYSYTGAIKKPRDVLNGGYLSWRDPVTNHWWQLTFFQGRRKFRDLGVLEGRTESLRATIDRLTPLPERLHGLPAKDKSLLTAREAEEAAEKSTGSKANAWRAQIRRIKSAASGRR